MVLIICFLHHVFILSHWVYGSAGPSHLHQVVVSEADSQVQRGEQGRVEDVGVGPEVQKSPAAPPHVFLHCPV